MAVEPPPSSWVFPSVHGADPDGPVAIGGDLEPGTLLAGYRAGVFPMPIGRRRLGWWSPDPRAVLPVDGFHASRSMQRSMRRFEVRVDTAFDSVVAGCADPSRPHGWISAPVIEAYRRLHHLGWAHSVEIWCDEELAGGLYGVAIGAFFAAESKFHRVRDASKAAVWALTRLLADTPHALIDVQWATPHLTSLGVVEISRDDYLERLALATESPPLTAWADRPEGLT